MKRQWGILAILVGIVVVLVGCGLFASAPASPAPTATVAVPQHTTLATPSLSRPMMVAQTEASPTATATQIPPTVTLLPTVMATPTATATPTPVTTLTATATPVPPTPTATLSPIPVPPTATPSRMPTIVVPSSSATLTVNGQSIAYRYPIGWSLRQETKDRYSMVMIEGPEGAFLSLTMYGTELDPRQLSASLLETMKKQFTGATVMPLQDTVGGYAAEGYTMRFKHFGVPMTSTILSFRGGTASFTLYTQAADEDLVAVQPGFDLIKTTLVVK